MIYLQAQVSSSSAFEMPAVEWSLLVPLLVMSLAPILLVTVTSVVPAFKYREIPSMFTAAAAALSLTALFDLWGKVTDPAQIAANQFATNSFGEVEAIGGSLLLNGYVLIAWGLIAVGVLFTSGLFERYLKMQGFVEQGVEWHVLLMISGAGGMIMVAAQDFILLFVGLEVLSIAVYVLVALHMKRSTAQEASFKYFILGAIASAIFAYGIALVYGATGTTDIESVAEAGRNALGLDPAVDSSMILVGIALLLAGFAFKIGAVPFHAWTPDVYQGAASPVAAFMASAIKVAAAVTLGRVLVTSFGEFAVDWQPLVAVLAVLSLIGGAFMALVQTDTRRMLAYSSISHVGFMLVAIYSMAAYSANGSAENASNMLSATEEGTRSLMFYLMAYTFMAIGSFAVLTVLGLAMNKDDASLSLVDLSGAAKHHPILAGAFSILLFAQAGIPFTAGFWAKLRVILAATSAESYLLAAVAILSAVVAAVLYLRIVVAMFMRSSKRESDVVELSGFANIRRQVTEYPPAAMAVIAACVAGVLVLGFYPEVVSGILEQSAVAPASR